MVDHQEKLLVVRLSSLGDLVHTLPVVPAFRASFPHARLDWLVDWRWSSLMKLVPGIDEVVPLERTLSGHIACVQRLRRARYSCAVDFQGLWRSALLARLSGARRCIGRDRKTARELGSSLFYTERVTVAGRHIAEMSMSLAAYAGAQPSAEMQFPLSIPDEVTHRVRDELLRKGITDYVVVSPGGGWKSKLWPAERYGALCAEVSRRYGVPCLVNVAPNRQSLAESVVRAAEPEKPLVVSLPLPELAALLAGAALVAAADTGPLHLAAALGTPVVGLFGSTDPARNGPLPRGTVVQNAPSELRHYERGTYERGRAYSPQMLSITVEQVLAAIERELRASR
jgi:lipopolysaccharide heptosyltransferase I